jgi:hypothetical protein
MSKVKTRTDFYVSILCRLKVQNVVTLIPEEAMHEFKIAITFTLTTFTHLYETALINQKLSFQHLSLQAILRNHSSGLKLTTRQDKS